MIRSIEKWCEMRVGWSVLGVKSPQPPSERRKFGKEQFWVIKLHLYIYAQ